MEVASELNVDSDDHLCALVSQIEYHRGTILAAHMAWAGQYDNGVSIFIFMS